MKGLTLPQCRILQDVVQHGTPACSLKRHLQQRRRGHLSYDNLCQTFDKLRSKSSSASPSLHSPRYADTFQFKESQHMSEEAQLSFSYHFHQFPLYSSALHNHLITHSDRPRYLHRPSMKPHFCGLNFRFHIFCYCPSFATIHQ